MNKKEKTGLVLLRILFGILLAAFLGSVCYLGYYYFQIKQREEIYETLTTQVGRTMKETEKPEKKEQTERRESESDSINDIIESETENVLETEQSEFAGFGKGETIAAAASKSTDDRQLMTELSEPAETETVETESPIDFASLEKINPDIYAWIWIPDTKIDYPVVQDPKDNTYYLNRTIERKEGYPGSIYSELENAKDFSDPNTILYGHNMRDGSMFGELKLFQDYTYMEKHPYVYIYTPEETIRYEVFAAVTFDNRHILKTYDFTKWIEYQIYLDTILGIRNMESYVRTDIEVTPEDQILTLSTCVGGGRDTTRLLLEAVRRDEP